MLNKRCCMWCHRLSSEGEYQSGAGTAAVCCGCHQRFAKENHRGRHSRHWNRVPTNCWRPAAVRKGTVFVTVIQINGTANSFGDCKMWVGLGERICVYFNYGWMWMCVCVCVCVCVCAFACVRVFWCTLFAVVEFWKVTSKHAASNPDWRRRNCQKQAW